MGRCNKRRITGRWNKKKSIRGRWNKKRRMRGRQNKKRMRGDGMREEG
jgi:hypothetical protein